MSNTDFLFTHNLFKERFMCRNHLPEQSGELNEKVFNFTPTSPPHGFYGDIIMKRSINV